METYCGANDCQDDFNEKRANFSTESCPSAPIQEGVEDSLLYTLMGIYFGVGLLGAVIIGVLVDPFDARYCGQIY